MTEMTQTDWVILASILGSVYWVMAIAFLYIYDVIRTPRRWPLAFTAATWAASPVVLPLALLVATAARLVQPTDRDDR